MKRVAFLLKGGVSRCSGSTLTTGTLYDHSPYVNFVSTKLSIDKHIIHPNPEYTFDFFLHSWNQDLQESLKTLYNPVALQFEDNNLYTSTINQKLYNSNSVDPGSFRQISQFLSLHQGCKLVENFSRDYDLIIVYRYDLLLWKDMILDEYDLRTISVNSYGDCNGDFHMVTDISNLHHLAEIYNSIGPTNPPTGHMIVKTYVENTPGLSIKMDNIVAGIDQEVTRKLKDVYIKGNIYPETLNEFGLTVDDIFQYNVE